MWIGVNTNCPCFKCPDRSQGCHGTCEKYAAYTEERKTLYTDTLQKSGSIVYDPMHPAPFTAAKAKHKMKHRRRRHGYKKGKFLGY